MNNDNKDQNNYANVAYKAIVDKVMKDHDNNRSRLDILVNISYKIIFTVLGNQSDELKKEVLENMRKYLFEEWSDE